MLLTGEERNSVKFMIAINESGVRFAVGWRTSLEGEMLRASQRLGKVLESGEEKNPVKGVGEPRLYTWPSAPSWLPVCMQICFLAS